MKTQTRQHCMGECFMGVAWGGVLKMKVISTAKVCVIKCTCMQWCARTCVWSIYGVSTHLLKN